MEEASPRRQTGGTLAPHPCNPPAPRPRQPATASGAPAGPQPDARTTTQEPHPHLNGRRGSRGSQNDCAVNPSTTRPGQSATACGIPPGPQPGKRTTAEEAPTYSKIDQIDQWGTRLLTNDTTRVAHPVRSAEKTGTPRLQTQKTMMQWCPAIGSSSCDFSANLAGQHVCRRRTPPPGAPSPSTPRPGQPATTNGIPAGPQPGERTTAEELDDGELVQLLHLRLDVGRRLLPAPQPPRHRCAPNASSRAGPPHGEEEWSPMCTTAGPPC